MEIIILLVVFVIYEHAKSVRMVYGYEKNQNENNKTWRQL
jgi:hypothetical protein